MASNVSEFCQPLDKYGFAVATRTINCLLSLTQLRQHEVAVGQRSAALTGSGASVDRALAWIDRGADVIAIVGIWGACAVVQTLVGAATACRTAKAGTASRTAKAGTASRTAKAGTARRTKSTASRIEWTSVCRQAARTAAKACRRVALPACRVPTAVI